MSKIVRTIASVFLPLVMVFGFYIIVHGHLTPGGGFQGGAVLATGIAMLAVALGTERLGGKMATGRLGAAEAFGLLMFIGIAIIGIGVSFFHNWIAGTNLPFGHLPPTGPNPGEPEHRRGPAADEPGGRHGGDRRTGPHSPRPHGGW